MFMHLENDFEVKILLQTKCYSVEAEPLWFFFVKDVR
jgi:hypothetical protein